MTSVITLLGADLDQQVGHERAALAQMMNLSAEYDQAGTLPSPFVLLTPRTQADPRANGHGVAWFHPPTNLYIVRTEHYPVLLTTNRCGTCGVAHLDVAHTYLYLSPVDFRNEAYLRYTHTPLDLVLPTST